MRTDPHHAAGFPWPAHAAVLWMVGCLLAGVAAGDETREHSLFSVQAGTGAPGEIDSLIRGLDNDDYAVREAAEQTLTKIGPAALEAVSQAARSDRFETSARAVSILLAWGKDERLSDFRLRALEALADLPDRPTESALAADFLAEVREDETINRLREMGAEVGPELSSVRLMPLGAQGGLQVTLGAGWRGGTEGLALLPSVRRATTVSLYNPEIGDEAFEHLGRMLYLRRVELYGTGVSIDAASGFKKQKPNVLVDVRSGARLGISEKQAGHGGALIDRVMSGSPAARAGLRPNDLIVRLNDQPIDSFEKLTQQIRTFQPGESVELTVKNGRAVRRVRVTFDAWNARPKFLEQRAASAQQRIQVIPTPQIRIPQPKK